MFLLSTLATFSLVLRCISAQLSVSVAQPPDFPGTETPYQVTPTGTDIPAATSSDAATNNKVGTFLYAYTDCNKNFGDGAKGKIDDSYYDAWVMSK